MTPLSGRTSRRVFVPLVCKFVYDRAGMGRSATNESVPFSLDNDVLILKAALEKSGVSGSILMVGHSYGGAISLVAAETETRIKGIVLIDSVVPGVWPQAEVEKTVKAMRADYDVLRKEAPELAKVAIPFGEAFPKTAARVDAIVVSDTLPITDIVAELGQNSPESAKSWRDIHAAFSAKHLYRKNILALGSSHKVMKDKPDLVVGNIVKMIEQLRSANDSH
jgi:pimeloyl-ACP methyl ester carboxylesterase